MSRPSSRYIMCLYLTVAGLWSVAQPMLYFRNLDVSDGLPNNAITCFFQDEQGFIWMGTRDGLVRYDGISTETYYHIPDDTSSIGSNSIAWQMEHDQEGRIWILLQGRGICRYDPKVDAFESFSFENGKLQEEWANRTEHLVLRENGDMIVVCQDGMIQFNDRGQVSLLTKAKQEHGLLFNARLLDDRWLWVSTGVGFDRYDLKEQVWASDQRNQLNPDLKVLRKTRGVLFQDRICYFSTFDPIGRSNSRYLYRLDLIEQGLDSIPIAPGLERNGPYSDLVNSIAIDRNGTLWLGTEQMGLIAYESGTDQWKRFEGGLNWKGDLKPGSILNLYCDRNNNLWIATLSGVSLMAPERQYFMNYDEVNNDAYGAIELTGITKMAVGPEGDIWLGKREVGLLNLNAEKERRSTYLGAKEYAEYQRYMDPIMMLDDGLLIHTWFNGLQFYDPYNGEINVLDPDRNAQPELRDAFIAHDGTVYAWGWGRFGVLNPATKELERVFRPLTSDGANDLVWQATEDPDGNIWLGMERSGLVCLDPNGMKVIETWSKDTSIYNKTTIGSVVHQDGLIWGALGNEGLLEYVVADKTSKLHTKSEGICSNDLRGLILDGQGALWMYSSSGISWYDTQQHRFKSFAEADGMLSQNIVDAALLPNGSILLLSDRGLIQFDPERLKMASEPRIPSLRSIQVYDQNINTREWEQDREAIVVPFDKNYLRVEFSAFEFFEPERIRFAYRLQGAEEFWNYTDHRPVAIYTNLGGGDYQLCVKRTNVDGIWGPELCIPLFVTTPFYQKAWFILLVVASFIAIGIFIYRWQLARKMAVVAVRDQLSRDLHDDVGSALSSINIFSTVATQQVDQNKQKAKELLEKIGSSAQGMMRNMDDIIWTLDPSNDQVEQFASRMRQFAMPVLEAKGVRVKFEVDNSVRELKLDMVYRRNLFMIFKEAINNLAKYSEASTVWIELKQDRNDLLMKIVDNGKGFDVDALNDRHGLNNMKARALELNGRTTVYSRIGEGTRIEVTVPIT